MTALLIFAGCICLISFVILCIRQVDFCIIWLVGAVCFLISGGYCGYRTMNPAGFRLPGFVLYPMILLALAVGISFAVTEGKIIGAMSTKPEPGCEFVIVLGAQVKKTTPSKALRLRLECAADYLRSNPDTTAVLSGGKGDGEEISEAQCMYEYLTEQGIRSDRLILEDESTTTRENLLNSIQMISKETGIRSPKERKTGLITNNFHVYRAMKLAVAVGFTDIHQIAAKSDPRLQIHYMVREYFAMIKALLKRDF